MESITRVTDWRAISDPEVAKLAEDLSVIYSRFPISQTPNESQTEDDLIWPILVRLGWTASLRQQNLAAKGRDDVPDGLLFQDGENKDRANSFSEEWKRYGFGLAVVESKRWNRPLDRQSGRRGEETAPSTQMLRYLRRVEDLTTGKLRWGILTNGRRWRLYFQGARSVSEQFFEIDLALILAIPGHDGGLFALSEDDRRHWLKVFALVFRRDSFIATATDQRSFHLRAIDEGRFYEERVAENLSNMVFGTVFPHLVRAIANFDSAAPLQEVREAALILLYRLLFILYAEDRDLLPVRDERYGHYGLRARVRQDIGKRKDRDDTFSDTAAHYWSVLDDLFRAINSGDRSIGLPPYNGGLFDPEKTPLLARVRLGDTVMAEVIDVLSFERTPDGRKYINYRDLSVQQLGSIYERLLEHEVVREGPLIDVRPNIFARKGSGSYYTPDDLVRLVIRETVEPLVLRCMDAFFAKTDELEASNTAEDRKIGILSALDPAERLLELKICDPAMGSGHFLVSLVDYLADQVIAAMAEAQVAVTYVEYVSPLIARIAAIRTTILRNADERGWTIDPEQLDDRHIVRRMVLKRCIYGVDKNQMAVELAKVSLWLHTFTVGAPLSFLDHHLRGGDSLFGSWVRPGIDKATALGAPLLLHDSISRAVRAASKMQIIEGLTDAEIAEAHRSKDVFDEVREMTAPLNAFLSLIHAFDWLNIKSREDHAALLEFLTGRYGDPVLLATGKRRPSLGNVSAHAADSSLVMKGRASAKEVFDRFMGIFKMAQELISEECFLNWQVAFPGVWSDWQVEGRIGGFDAIIGNPPWDRFEFEEVPWFEARDLSIALEPSGAKRKARIKTLESNGDVLWLDFKRASNRLLAATNIARKGGIYSRLNSGKLNLYKLFLERAFQLVKPGGMVGMLTPSGIAGDLSSSTFFSDVATSGHLKAFYDFENRRSRYGLAPFFPDVDSRFKFSAFIASPELIFPSATCAFFLQSPEEILDPEKTFEITSKEFAVVNPNTGTAPIFRSRRDMALSTAIYSRLPILVDRSGAKPVFAWPVRYVQMINMTSDSHLFRTRHELLEREGAWPVGSTRFKSAAGDWMPLYEGKMVQGFDHRAASIVVNPSNPNRPAQPLPATLEQHVDPAWVADPQFWIQMPPTAAQRSYALGFKDVTAPTNVRSMIAAIVPSAATGNTLPLIEFDQESDRGYVENVTFLAANLNSLIYDFTARQKIQGQHLNWFIVEQIPVVPPIGYSKKFGNKSAADIVRNIVLELTYTANDMKAFAHDFGYLNAHGDAPPPFLWDDERRLKLRAKLDAVFFHLYGVTDRDDVRYIYSTFPIVEREESAAYGGRYRSRDLCLAYMSALAAGHADAEIDL